MLKKFLASFDTRSGPERLAASPWATATTPDQIIVAHVLQSMAKNLNDWRWRSSELPDVRLAKRYKTAEDVPSEFRYSKEYYLIGPDIELYFQLDRRFINPMWGIQVSVSVVRGQHNTLALDTEAGNVLTTRIGSLWSQLVAARKAAEQAEHAMKLNEKKWNLAEELLGMKRNEFGALVPKDQ